MSSTRSKPMSDILLEKKVKAETAKARLASIQGQEKLKRDQYELELRVQKSRSEMESNLNILKCKQEVIESEAELKVIEEIAEEINVSKRSGISELRLPRETSKKSDIVNNYISKLPIGEDILDPVIERPYSVKAETHIQDNTNEGIKILTKYIMKKYLLISRLSSFDDNAERYCSWKSRFLNIVNELEVSARDEIDLLIRYLGPDSKRQANSISAANTTDEQEALNKIWARLDQRFGAPEQVADSLRHRIERFPRIGADKSKLYDLADLLEEIECVKCNERYSLSLSYFDSALGVNSILGKLPSFIQNKWIDHCTSYKTKHDVMFPPFFVFVDFVRSFAIKLNDPSFNFERVTNRAGSRSTTERSHYGTNVYNRKTRAISHLDNSKSSKGIKVPNCVLHGDRSNHELKNCRVFLQKLIPEKRDIVMKQGLCFKCLTYKHLASECRIPIKCEKCSKTNHCTAFHIDSETSSNGGQESSGNQGGEPSRHREHGGEVNPMCTEICGRSLGGKSCAKTVLVNIYPEGERQRAIKCYAIIDDQSNRTLGKSELFGHFSDSLVHLQEETYTLATCAGSFATVGKCISGLVVESPDATCVLKCPTVLECNDIPDNKNEIATPNIARQYPHLKSISHLIPEFQSDTSILILIGRDMLQAHHVLDQRLGRDNEPYAHQLRLGWTIIGETCLGKVHEQSTINVNKISVLNNGRGTILLLCESMIHIKDSDVFTRTRDDDVVGLSQHDKTFLKIMEKKSSVKKMKNGHLSAPLPFKEKKDKLPANYDQASKRAEALVRELRNKPEKCRKFLDFMTKIFDNNQAEIAPPAEPGEETWYLPIFGIFNSKKPDKIRVVFDAAAKYQQLSLNDVLLTGPDLTNNLEAILTKFRREKGLQPQLT